MSTTSTLQREPQQPPSLPSSPPQTESSKKHKRDDSQNFLQTTIRDRIRNDNQRDSLITNTETERRNRNSISATPQFATPAGQGGALNTDRDEKLGELRESGQLSALEYSNGAGNGSNPAALLASATSTSGNGLFTSSPSKTNSLPAGSNIKTQFDIDNDPDRPHDAINQSVIIEEIDMNGRVQKVYKKTYQLINGQTKVITRIIQN